MLFVLKVCIKHVTLKYYQNVRHNTKQMLKSSLQKTVCGNVRRERAFFMSLCTELVQQLCISFSRLKMIKTEDIQYMHTSNIYAQVSVFVFNIQKCILFHTTGFIFEVIAICWNIAILQVSMRMETIHTSVFCLT